MTGIADSVTRIDSSASRQKRPSLDKKDDPRQIFARPANTGSFGKLPSALRIGRQAFRLPNIMPGHALLHRFCLANLLRFAELPYHYCQAIRQSPPRRRSGWQQTGFALAYPLQPQAAAIFRRAQAPFASRSKIAAASGPPLHFGPPGAPVPRSCRSPAIEAAIGAALETLKGSYHGKYRYIHKDQRRL